METILVGLAMLVPAIFAVLLITGGIVMVALWAFAQMPAAVSGRFSPAAGRRERRNGRERRHRLTDQHRRPSAVV